LQQEARGLEIELLSRDYRTMHADLESVDHEAREVEAQEAEQVAEQARLDSEQEAIRLRMNDAAEAISRVRDTLAGTEQRQSQALTAAEVERNRTELFERQRMQAAQEMERLAADQEQAQSEIETLRAMLLQLEGDIVEQEVQFQQADVEAKSLAGHRASAVAEEERARKDVLNLAVLVANTEQSLTQVTARQQETAARAERVSREQEQLVAQVAGLDQQRDLLAAQREEASGRIQELMAERQAAIERIEGLGGQITGLDRDIVKFSEDVAGVESRLGALQGVVREEMGYGREGEEEGTALKTCDGVREALAEWLVIPPGLDRAVETILGERVRGWLVDEPSAACRAVEFLKGKELGRGAFLPQQLRWAPEQAALDSSASWWPTLNGQAGVVGRATDLIRAEGASAATLSYLFDGIVFVESLDVALQLWQQHQWAAPAGPTYVTLSGETLDAAGVMTGGAAVPVGACSNVGAKYWSWKPGGLQRFKPLSRHGRRGRTRRPSWGSDVKMSSASAGRSAKRRCWSCRCRKTMRAWNASAGNCTGGWRCWRRSCSGALPSRRGFRKSFSPARRSWGNGWRKRSGRKPGCCTCENGWW
jgi:chromosome segregation protein